jgi:hypothetical protein
MVKGRITNTTKYWLVKAELSQLSEAIGNSDTTSHSAMGLSDKEATSTKSGTHTAIVSSGKAFTAIQFEGFVDCPVAGPMRTSGT